MNSVINNQTYADLVVKVLPTAIQSEDEYEIMLANIDELMSKKEDTLSPEEVRLLETLSILVESYEDEHYPIPESSPNEVLKFLMEDRELKQKDLLHIFGSTGITSEVVNGKRSISKAQAKKLAEHFKVSVELFI
jgi:HTH-type transcriptional regulator / antitoxin HigA